MSVDKRVTVKALKIIDNVIHVGLYSGAHGQTQLILDETCTKSGFIKGAGIVIKGQFTEEYRNTGISRIVNPGERFSSTKGSVKIVSLTATSPTENIMLLAVPVAAYQGGVILRHSGHLNKDDVIETNCRYLAIVGDGAIVNKKRLPGTDVYRTLGRKYVKSLGDNWYIGFDLAPTLEEFSRLRRALCPNNPVPEVL